MQILDLDRTPFETGRSAPPPAIDLHSQDLSGSDLTRTNFVGAKLAGRDISHSNLSKTDLSNADFRWADLSHTEMQDCKHATASQFGGADLCHANVAGTIDLAPSVEFADRNIRYARVLTVSLVAACAYCGIGLLGITDSQVLADTGKFSLPIVGISMSPSHFLLASPLLILFLSAYAYLHLQHTWEAIADLPRRLPDGRHIWQAITPWLPTTSVAQRFFAPSGQRAQKWLWHLVDTTVYRLPYLTCLLVWGRSVAFHRPFLSLYFAAFFLISWLFAHERLIRRDRCFESKWHTIAKNQLLPPMPELILTTTLILALTLAPLKLSGIPAIPVAYRPYVVADYQDFGAAPPHLGGPNLAGLNLRRASFRGASMVSADLRRSLLDDANFSFANLERAQMGHAAGHGAVFSQANLAGSEIVASVFPNADFTRSILTDAKIGGCDVLESDFTFATLHGCGIITTNALAGNFHGVTGELPAFDTSIMIGARFSTAELCRFRFNGTELGEANFWRSELRIGTFVGAWIEDSNFSSASIEDVNFSGASLTGAVFLDARLVNVDFREAEGLTHSQLQLAAVVSDVILPDYLTDAPYSNIDVTGDFQASKATAAECEFAH